MTEEQAREFVLRAVDGELSAHEERRLRAYAARHPELLEFWETERRTRSQADALSASLRLPGPGLEESVLTQLGHRPRLSWKWRFGLGIGAAAALALFVVWWSGDEKPTERHVRETAVFETLEGVKPTYRNRGVFHWPMGRSRVTVEEPTLVETESGVVELEPGSYEVSVDAKGVTVTAFTGSARLRNGAEIVVVAAGASKTLAAPPKKTLTEVLKGALEAKDFVEDRGGAVRLVGSVVNVNGAPIDVVNLVVRQGTTVSLKDLGSGAIDVAPAMRPPYWVGVRVPGYAPSDEREITGAKGVVELKYVMRTKGGALAGRVVDAGGKGIAGAAVTVGGGWRELPVRPRSEEGLRLRGAPAQVATTDADGRVKIDALPAEWNRVRIIAPGYGPHMGWVRLNPEGVTEQLFELRSGGIVQGVIRNKAGLTLMDVHVELRQAGSSSAFEGVEAKTDTEGRFRIDNAPAGRVEIVARAKDGSQASGWIEVKPGKEHTWAAVLEQPNTIEGTVRYEDGEVIPGALVSCRRAFRGAGANLKPVTTNAAGRFRFDGLPNVLHTLSIWYPHSERRLMMAPDHTVSVLPEKSPLDVSLPRVENEEPAHVIGTVLLPDGAVALEARVTIWPVGSPGWRVRDITDAEGRFKLGPLKPGAYRLEIHRDGQPTMHLDIGAVTAGKELDLGAKQFPAPGRIHASFVDKDGKPYERVRVAVTSLDQSIFYSVTQKGGGVGVSESLAPGRYLVMGAAPGLIEEVEVKDGQTTNVEITLRGGRRITASFWLAGGAEPRELAYKVVDLKGRRILNGSLPSGTNTLDVWLSEGDYKMTAHDGRGHQIEFDLRVQQNAEADELTVELR